MADRALVGEGSVLPQLFQSPYTPQSFARPYVLADYYTRFVRLCLPARLRR